jgi:hypothetical protein
VKYDEEKVIISQEATILKEKMQRKGRNSKFPLRLRQKKKKISVMIRKTGQDPNAIGLFIEQTLPAATV